MTKNELGQVEFSDLAGLRFGSVTVLERFEKQPNGGCKWEYRCDCGVIGWAWAEVLKRSPTFCCPECRKQLIRKARTIHGGKGTRIYRIYSGMLTRCLNPKSESYQNYGGRGITVCEEWRGPKGFENFRRDMGDPPPLSTIERKDNNGNYEPSNCCWASRAEQGNNRRTSRHLTFNGETLTWSKWAKKLGLDKSTIRKRVLKGWPVEQVLSMEDHRSSP